MRWPSALYDSQPRISFRFSGPPCALPHADQGAHELIDPLRFQRPGPHGRRRRQAGDASHGGGRRTHRHAAVDVRTRRGRHVEEGRCARRGADRGDPGRETDVRTDPAVPPARDHEDRRRVLARRGRTRRGVPRRGPHERADRRRDGSADGRAHRPADHLRHVQGRRPRDGDRRSAPAREARRQVGQLGRRLTAPRAVSMRFFDAGQVHRALGFDALADAIADMLRSNPVAPLRHAHALSSTDSLLLMPAWSDGAQGALGVKLVTVMPGNRERSRATVNAIYVLLARDGGEPLAVIDGEALTLCRTAAASLLAARYLARPDAENVLVVGTGHLAPYMARAHCHGRNVSRLRIWGRNGVGAQTMAQIVHGAWLRPGCHLDLVGGFRRSMREADDAAVGRSRVYVDTFAGALAEAADIVEPLERGVIGRADVLGELAQLVTGAVPGRTSASQVTLFKSVGTAFEDLAAARLLLLNAGADA